MAWSIKTKADYDAAMAKLDDMEFIAEMSDDYRRCLSEKNDIARQRYELTKLAEEAGII